MLVNQLIDDLRRANCGNARNYRRAFKAIIAKYKLELIGSGSYTEVYSKANFKYVVKISKEAKHKFHKSYPSGYLQPLFISGNGLVAVQPRAITGNDVWAKYSDAEYRINKINEQIYNLEKMKETLIETRFLHKMEVEKFEGAKVYDHLRIPDTRRANIGMFEGQFYMIDLNNHLESPIKADQI